MIFEVSTALSNVSKKSKLIDQLNAIQNKKEDQMNQMMA